MNQFVQKSTQNLHELNILVQNPIIMQNTSIFGHLFCEFISYSRKIANDYQQSEKILFSAGYDMGLRLWELFMLQTRVSSLDKQNRTYGTKIEIQQPKQFLEFIKEKYWRFLFNKNADQLEKIKGQELQFYLIDKKPLTDKYISYPSQYRGCVPSCLIGGIIKAALDLQMFESDVEVHLVEQNMEILTYFHIKFKKMKYRFNNKTVMQVFSNQQNIVKDKIINEQSILEQVNELMISTNTMNSSLLAHFISNYQMFLKSIGVSETIVKYENLGYAVAQRLWEACLLKERLQIDNIPTYSSFYTYKQVLDKVTGVFWNFVFGYHEDEVQKLQNVDNQFYLRLKETPIQKCCSTMSAATYIQPIIIGLVKGCINGSGFSATVSAMNLKQDERDYYLIVMTKE